MHAKIQRHKERHAQLTKEMNALLSERERLKEQVKDIKTHKDKSP